MPAGLVGRAQALAITESFAAGNVTVRRGASGTGWISAGGLVGFLGYSASIGNMQQSSIADSYALGNVIVDNPFAGGACRRACGQDACWRGIRHRSPPAA